MLSAPRAADLADPIPIPAAPVDPVRFTWEGVYAGSGAGLVTGRINMRQGGNTGSFKFGAPGDKIGSTGYQFLGYNWVYGDFVLGVEAEIAVHEAKGTLDAGSTSGATADYLWNAGLRGRAGYSFGRILPFVSAGVSYLPLNLHAPENSADGSVDTFVGWNAGAGVDVAWTDSIATRLEYVYSDYGSADFRISGVATRASLQSHAVRAALIFKESAFSSGSGQISPGRSGPYGGVMAGYGIGPSRMVVDGVLDQDYTIRGGSYGLFGGYDYSFGSWFAGLDTNGLALLQSGSAGRDPNRVSGKLHWSADSRIRVGTTFGALSPYIAGGFSLAQIETRRRDAFGAGASSTDLAMHYGGTVAVGADYALNDRVFVRGEYAYSLYAPTSSNRLGFAASGENQLDKHDVRIGIGYRLGD